MDINATGGDDLAFACNHFGSRPDNYDDVWLHVGIARIADGRNTPILDRDIGLHNSPVIENERVGDDGINRALATRTLRLTHAVANDFSASELHLLAIDSEVLFHF